MAQGHHHPRRPDTDRRTLAGEEKRAKALQCRKAGLSYDAIGKQLGCTAQNAFRLVKSALEHIRTLGAEEAASLRQLELERLDAMLMGIWAGASRGDHAAIDRALRIMERRSRLLGLDAPQKLAPTSPDGTERYPLQDIRERLALIFGVSVADLPLD